MNRRSAIGFLAAFVLCIAGSGAHAAAAAPLRIGYSDWPGWVAWQIAIDKGWFREAGVNVRFDWFDYVASMEAYSAGKLDAVGMTNGDALVTGATGGKSVIVLVNDYSNGNDMIIAKPGIATLQQLKGQKIGVEVGFVDHLLLLNGLEKAGMKETDVTLVNTKTNETPQVLASGGVAAVAAWQPSAGQALKALPGARPVYTSAQAPGLIYDVLAVNPASVAARRAEWQKVVGVWYRVVDYLQDPKNLDDALKIMSARVGLKPAEYKPFLQGTKILPLADAKKVFAKADGLSSLYGSTKIADGFNVKYDVYKKSQIIDSYIDASLTAAQK